MCIPISTPLSTAGGANATLASPNNVYTLVLQPDGALLIISTATGAEVARLAGPCSSCTRPLRWAGAAAGRRAPGRRPHAWHAKRAAAASSLRHLSRGGVLAAGWRSHPPATSRS